MDARQVWQAALERIRVRVSPGAYTTWFRGAVGLALTGRRLTVGVSNTFASEHLRQRFADIARTAVSEVISGPAEVLFVVQSAWEQELDLLPTDTPQSPQVSELNPVPQQPPRKRRAPAVELRQQAALAAEPYMAPAPHKHPGVAGDQPSRRHSQAAAAQPSLFAPARAGRSENTASERPVAADAPQRATQPPMLSATSADESYDPHPRYLFETFVVGAANRLAYAAAQEVAHAPGMRYNPLLIYGPVGLGKTHLLHAIGRQVVADGRRVAYVTAEQFTNEIIDAIRHHNTEAFRRRYRTADVLLVDDVQFIAGKDSTEEEFFHTFNWLHEDNKQIVLTSDRPPQAMRQLHDRLRSRFQWGLMADIQPPDFAQRLDILRVKAQAQRLAAPDEVLVCLARPECASIRALEGSLTRVVAYAQMLRRPLDLKLVAEAQATLDSSAQAATRAIAPTETLAAVAQHYGTTVEALLGKTRERQVAWARQVAMYLLRESSDASLLQIGEQLGGRDHTTIMHGCARVGKALTSDERARADLAAIRALLGLGK